MTARASLLPGATLGVLGGGQLGRMFVHAAQRMGYFTAVLDPDPSSPAGRVSHHHLHACCATGCGGGWAQGVASRAVVGAGVHGRRRWGAGRCKSIAL